MFSDCVFFSSRQVKQYKNCEIIGLPRKYEFKPYAFAFQKNSPYLGLFNYYINGMRENGGLEKMRKECGPASQECQDLTGKPLGLKNCFGAILVMMVGVGSAITLMIIENILKKTKKKTSETIQNQSNQIEDNPIGATSGETWYSPRANNVEDESRPKAENAKNVSNVEEIYVEEESIRHT